MAYLGLAGIILLFSSLPFLFPQLRQLGSTEFIREFVLSFGIFSFIAYILLVILSVPFIIPSTPVILSGGYIFGTPLAMVLSMIGIILGSTLAFYLTRLGGKPLLKKLVDTHHITHFNMVLRKRGSIAAFISYALPIFPSDSVSLLLGLTAIHYSLFLFLVIAGHIPRLLIIISLGADLYQGLTWFTFLSFAVAALFILIAVFREKIKKLFFKELHAFEKEVRLAELLLEKEYGKIEKDLNSTKN